MKKIEIEIGSPIDHEELVAYIIIEGKYLALLNQDRGKENLMIEFFDEPKIKEIDYDVFLEALIKAKEILLNV